MRGLIVFLFLTSGPLTQAQDLSGQVYILVDDVLNTDCEVVPDCDCCASDLAFLSKDTFALIVRCLSGDEFYKGAYEATPSSVTLNYIQYVVSEELDDDYKWKANEKKEARLNPDRFEIDLCDGRPVLKNLTNHHFKSGSRLAEEAEASVIKELTASKALQMLD